MYACMYIRVSEGVAGCMCFYCPFCVHMCGYISPCVCIYVHTHTYMSIDCGHCDHIKKAHYNLGTHIHTYIHTYIHTAAG